MTRLQPLGVAARLVHDLRPALLYPVLALMALLVGSGLVLPPPTAESALKVAHLAGGLGAIGWALAGSRLLLAQRAYRQLRLPHAGPSVAMAVALLAGATVLLPALVLVARFGLDAQALVLLVLVNTAGIVWATAPGVLAIVAVVPWAWGESLFALLPAAWRLAATTLSALLMLVFGAMAWRTALRADPSRRWLFGLAPWVLRLGDQPGLGNAIQTRITAQRRSATAPVTRHERRRAFDAHRLDRAHREPVTMLRVILSPRMARGTLKRFDDVSLIWATLLLLSVPLARVIGLDDGGNIVLLSAASLLFLPLLTDVMVLNAMVGESGAGNSLAEAALLPGLGRAPLQRLYLLQATLGWSLPKVVIVGGLATLLAVALQAPQHLAVLVALATLLAGATTVLFTMRTLAMRPPCDRLHRVLEPFGWFFVLTLATSTGLYCATFNPAEAGVDRALVWLMGAGWLSVLGISVWNGLRDWRRFTQRPHPFVQP